MFAFGLAGLVFGLRAWLTANRARQTPALAIAGTLTSAIGLLGWLFAVVAYYMALMRW